MNKQYSPSSMTCSQLPISSKIICHEVITEKGFFGRKFVQYSIKINTYYTSWIVQKRYSNFEDLHKRLIGKIKTLPLLPPKRFFKHAEATIQERTKLLDLYLNTLFRTVNICSYEDILQFIEIEKDLLNLFLKNNTVVESSANVTVKRYFSLKKSSSHVNSIGKKARSADNPFEEEKSNNNYYNTFLNFKLMSTSTEKSANMIVIEEFLRNLDHKSENKIDIIKTFEEFLKSKLNWPSFKKEEIIKLLTGENPLYLSGFSSNSGDSEDSINSKGRHQKGLLHHVGIIEENLLGSEACLDFVGKLIDFEYNPECEAYIYVLKTTKMQYLTAMKLHKHIKRKKASNVTAAYKILKALISDDRSYNAKLRKLINDDEVFQNFTLWYEKNNQNF